MKRFLCLLLCIFICLTTASAITIPSSVTSKVTGDTVTFTGYTVSVKAIRNSWINMLGFSTRIVNSKYYPYSMERMYIYCTRNNCGGYLGDGYKGSGGSISHNYKDLQSKSGGYYELTLPNGRLVITEHEGSISSVSQYVTRVSQYNYTSTDCFRCGSRSTYISSFSSKSEYESVYSNDFKTVGSQSFSINNIHYNSIRFTDISGIDAHTPNTTFTSCTFTANNTAGVNNVLLTNPIETNKFTGNMEFIRCNFNSPLTIAGGDSATHTVTISGSALKQPLTFTGQQNTVIFNGCTLGTSTQPINITVTPGALIDLRTSSGYVNITAGNGSTDCTVLLPEDPVIKGTINARGIVNQSLDLQSYKDLTLHLGTTGNISDIDLTNSQNCTVNAVTTETLNIQDTSNCTVTTPSVTKLLNIQNARNANLTLSAYSLARVQLTASQTGSFRFGNVGNNTFSVTNASFNYVGCNNARDITLTNSTILGGSLGSSTLITASGLTAGTSTSILGLQARDISITDSGVPALTLTGLNGEISLTSVRPNGAVTINGSPKKITIEKLQSTSPLTISTGKYGADGIFLNNTKAGQLTCNTYGEVIIDGGTYSGSWIEGRSGVPLVPLTTYN